MSPPSSLWMKVVSCLLVAEDEVMSLPVLRISPHLDCDLGPAGTALLLGAVADGTIREVVPGLYGATDLLGQARGRAWVVEEIIPAWACLSHESALWVRFGKPPPQRLHVTGVRRPRAVPFILHWGEVPGFARLKVGKLNMVTPAAALVQCAQDYEQPAWLKLLPALGSWRPAPAALRSFLATRAGTVGIAQAQKRLRNAGFLPCPDS